MYFYFYLEKQQFILVSNNFKNFIACQKKVESFENKCYLVSKPCIWV